MFRRHWIVALAFGIGIATTAWTQESSKIATQGQPSIQRENEKGVGVGQDGLENEKVEAIDPIPALDRIESAIRDLKADVNDSEKKQEKEQRRRDLEAQEGMVLWAKWMFYATFATVIITFFALIAIVRTLHHTKRAADAADGMLNEAKDTTQAARDQLRLADALSRIENAPYFNFVRGVYRPVNGVPKAMIILKNEGASPAKIAWVKSASFYWTNNEGEELEFPISPHDLGSAPPSAETEIILQADPRAAGFHPVDMNVGLERTSIDLMISWTDAFEGDQWEHQLRMLIICVPPGFATDKIVKMVGQPENLHLSRSEYSRYVK